MAAQALTMTHTPISVAATSTVVLAANLARSYCLLVNDSDTDIYINIAGGAAVLNRGIRIAANGGSYEMLGGQSAQGAQWPSGGLGNVSSAGIKAIHGGSGTKNLLITEG